MEEIILATHNLGKVKELKQILQNDKVLSLKEAGIDLEIEEDQPTFEGNALKKARTIYQLTGKICIADDSGLCIEALDGFPGVKTARFLGENASQKERNDYILHKMKSLEKSERKANVVTCIAVVNGNGQEKVYTGVLSGYIADRIRGNNGFGFDEIFEIEDGRTLAQLDAEEKNIISSRRKAIEQLQKDWI